MIKCKVSGISSPEGFCLANCDGSIYAKCCRSLPKEISLNKISNFTNKSCRSFTPVSCTSPIVSYRRAQAKEPWRPRTELRCFYRVYLSVSVHTTAMVQLRWFLLREIGLSVQTTAMLLPSQGNK
nr:hypothetical protein Q903MT_gene515 [Picea sitchensis]